VSTEAFLTLRRESHVPWSPAVELEVRCVHATTRRQVLMPRAWNRDPAGVAAIAALLAKHPARTRCTCADRLAANYRAVREEVPV